MNKHQGASLKRRIFKGPQSEDKIYELSFKNFSEQSRKKIRWAVNMYDEWRLNRMKELFVSREIRNVDLNFVKEFSESDLCHALCRFIGEVKKLDNSDYPPNTLREIIIMIQMHLHQNGVYWKLLDQVEFQNLHNVVDNTMKERTAQGLGIRKSCSIISLELENKLFSANALGESNPEQLLQTVIYLLGLHLALRGGVEHTRLRRPGFNPEISTEIDEESGHEFLIYREDPLQKMNQGGLTGKANSKVVKVFPSEDKVRCPVRLYAKYIGLLPRSKSCGKLYLHPKVKAVPNIWFCDQPYGKNKIYSTVKELCKKAGLEGKFTNHSLRALSATHMFDSDVSEQVIKEIIGHKSDCVRVYKRTSDHLLKEASDSITGVKGKGNDTKKIKSDDSDNISLMEEMKKCNKESLSACQMMKNVIKTRMELRKSKVKKGIKKVVSKIIKRNKQKLVKKVGKVGPKGRIVIDLNVNFKC